MTYMLSCMINCIKACIMSCTMTCTITVSFIMTFVITFLMTCIMIGFYLICTVLRKSNYQFVIFEVPFPPRHDMIEDDSFSDLKVALILVIEIRIVSIQTFLIITDKSNIWTGEMKMKNCFTFKYNVRLLGLITLQIFWVCIT